MEWTQEHERWVSGPYVIELIEPKNWLLTITDEDGAGSLVRVDRHWSGSSLSELKSLVEQMERRRRDRSVWSRSLAVLVLSAIVVGLAFMSSGLISSVLGIGAFFVFMAMIPRIADGWRRRPWDSLRGTYQ